MMHIFSEDPWLLARMITDLELVGVYNFDEACGTKPKIPFKNKICFLTLCFTSSILKNNKWYSCDKGDLYYSLTQGVSSKIASDILTEDSYNEILRKIEKSIAYKWK